MFSAQRRLLTLFLVFSTADFFLTWWLLERSEGLVYESNPLASWFLGQFGWAGLGYFKAACVLLASTGFVAAGQSPTAARGLSFACLAQFGVVAYSWLLILWLRSPDAQDYTQAIHRNRELNQQLQTTKQLRKEYLHQVAGLHRELRTGRRTLARAARMWLNVRSAWAPPWLLDLRASLPARAAEMRLAARLKAAASGPAESRRLEAEFRASYGRQDRLR